MYYYHDFLQDMESVLLDSEIEKVENSLVLK